VSRGRSWRLARWIRRGRAYSPGRGARALREEGRNIGARGRGWIVQRQVCGARALEPAHVCGLDFDVRVGFNLWLQRASRMRGAQGRLGRGMRGSRVCDCPAGRTRARSTGRDARQLRGQRKFSALNSFALALANRRGACKCRCGFTNFVSTTREHALRLEKDRRGGAARKGPRPAQARASLSARGAEAMGGWLWSRRSLS